MAIERRELIVHVSELALGMHVVRLDRPWLHTDFPIQGLRIASQKDIDALQRQCEYVFIESTESSQRTSRVTDLTANPPGSSKERRRKRMGLFARLGKRKKSKAGKSDNTLHGKPLCTHRPKPAERVVYHDKVPTEKELPKATISYSEAKASVSEIMEAIRIGKSPNVERNQEAVNDIVDSVLRNKDALLWLTKIKHKDAYTAEHSLNVCVLSATFARFLGHSDDEIRQIATAAMLHDVGKSRVPSDILNKEGRFTDEEFEIMKLHTVYGRDMLLGINGADRIAVDVAHSHHERVDGSGYPRGLTDKQIPYYAKVIALV
ncbi:MAG: DUF3391 domain-containing protein, partial [Oleiphilaceae bacterium]|nr:DUF3391 domain-containing protein [Oleiphilaceae bacterium]